MQTKKTDAAQGFAAKRDEINDLAAKITAEINRRGEVGADWGDFASAGKVASDLRELAAFLGVAR